MNDEMAVKRRGGTRSKLVVERMLNVFDLHFPIPAVEAVSRIYACKTERNLKMFGWCLQFKQSCPWATPSYFCLQNKAGKSTQCGESSQKMYQKSSVLSIPFECEEVSLQIEFTTLPPKNHNLFVKIGTKRELEKKELRPQANNAQYNTQGRGGWGEVRRQWGGGGRLLYINLYMSQVK
jgi:hypothetical protein